LSAFWCRYGIFKYHSRSYSLDLTHLWCYWNLLPNREGTGEELNLAKCHVHLYYTAVGDSPRSIPEGIQDTVYNLDLLGDTSYFKNVVLHAIYHYRKKEKVRTRKKTWQNWKVRPVSKSGDPLRITYHYFSYYPGFEKNFSPLKSS